VLPLNTALHNYKNSSKNYHNHYIYYILMGGVFLGALWAIEREVRQCQRLINHLLWHTDDEIHTKDSLARFFRFHDDVELQLDRLVDLDILKKAESGAYTVSKNQLVHEAIKLINERDRTARNLVDSVLSHFF